MRTTARWARNVFPPFTQTEANLPSKEISTSDGAPSISNAFFKPLG